MSSRRPVRQLLVAVLLGVLVGGGLMAVTPAGAEVSQAAATSWKKIWKKNLKPLADKRYYTKSKARSTFATKSDAAASGAAAQAGANAATDSKLGNYYTKADADARFRTNTQLTRGTFLLGGGDTGGADFMTEALSFGVTLAAAPTPHFVPAAGPVPAGCRGSAAAPDADPGHLCVFETIRLNVTDTPGIYAIAGGPGSNGMGALMTVTSTGSGTAYVAGSWAVRPAAIDQTAKFAPGRAGDLGVSR